MKIKLTLMIEDKLVESAKSFAHKKGESLPSLVESYFKSISDNNDNEETLSPKVLKLLGAVKLQSAIDYKTSLSSALLKKYRI